MAVEFKDYYQTLGVSKTASQDEIKQAFRKLSRKYHPDVAKDKATAEEKFKEINEAYQVLGDPEKRGKYDRLGADWEHAGEYRPPPGGGGPRDRTHDRRYGGGGVPFGDEETFHFGGTGFSDFFETFFGGMSGMEGEAFRETFGGRTPGDRVGRDVEADIMVTLEEVLHGSTRKVTLQRRDESGRPGKTETYQVRIPPGVAEGQRIRLAGQGEPGTGSGRPGHLFLRVRLAAHPYFRVQGQDLHYDLRLAPWEAVLGCRIKVPTPTGSVSLQVPPGTQNGRTFRVRGHGLPRKPGERGDLYVKAEIRIPSRIPEKERVHWEELAKNSTFEPRNEK